MNRSKKKNDDDHDTKPAACGAVANIEENNNEDSHNQRKNEADDTNSTTGLASYAYRDFSNVPNDTGYLDAIQSRVRPPSKKLPAKLHAMLTDPALSSIIAWLPHGRSWLILDRHRFTNEVLPQYFDHSNFESFIRLVNAWGFRRVPSGVDRDSYYHELFLRGMPHLYSRMTRMNSKKAPMQSRHQCPNFYKMPLPDCPGSNTTVKSYLAGLMATSESSKPAAASRSNEGGVHVQGAMQQYPNEGGKVDLHNNPNNAPISLAGYTTQSFPMNSHAMFQGMQPSLSQSYPQQVVGMHPTNIFWDMSSNMHLLAPFAASASVTNQPGNPPHLRLIPNSGSFYEEQLQLIQQPQPHGVQEQQQRPQHPIHIGFQTSNQQPARSNASFLSSNQVSAFLPSNSIVTGRYQSQPVSLPDGHPIGSGANSQPKAGRREDTSLSASSQNSDSRTVQKSEKGYDMTDPIARKP